jgi:hypothetical protein
MGQTQLLLVVLGILLVGLAIYVGISLFGANTVENTRNAIILDLQNFGTRALTYYAKPPSQAGGGKSFIGVTIGQIYPMIENVNARYYIESATDNECVIVGVGKIVSGSDSIRVRYRVTPQGNILEIIN